VKLLEEFVPVADNPHRYRQVQEPQRAKLEYRIVYDAMLQTGFRNSMSSWHVQGMYVITPSGKVIAGRNNPFSVEATMYDMRQGLDRYAKMPRAERLLPKSPDATADRMSPESAHPRPPADGLVLRAVTRGLDENGSKWDVLTPAFYKIDRLWYTREEAARFLPEPLAVGARKQVTGPVFDGMVQLHLGGFEQTNRWFEPDIKERSLSVQVTALSGGVAKLALTGAIDIESKSADNGLKFRADLLGYAAYDTATRRFLQFDLIAYGDHSVGPAFLEAGKPTTMPLGVWLTLNGANVNDAIVPTRRAHYRSIGLKAIP
jgi:hypothetical protein